MASFLYAAHSGSTQTQHEGPWRAAAARMLRGRCATFVDLPLTRVLFDAEDRIVVVAGDVHGEHVPRMLSSRSLSA